MNIAFKTTNTNKNLDNTTPKRNKYENTGISKLPCPGY
jgi:hypothetical protein